MTRPPPEPTPEPTVLPLPSEPFAPIAPTPEFLAACAELGIEFDAGDLDKLGRFVGVLLSANRTMNLTAIREPADVWMRHIFDALTLMPMLAELPDGAAVIDVGSGGGVPGLPLAIVLPRLRFTLMEATGKKAAFLERAAGELGLANVRVLHERAERAGQDRGVRSAASAGGPAVRSGGHREAYDAVLARALGRLAVAAELCVPLAKVGGQVILVKGQKADEEIAEAREALHLLHAQHATTIPTPTGRVVILEKPGPTPKTYPRRDGEPSRSPLGVKKPPASI